jgi:phage gpG-like protein
MTPQQGIDKMRQIIEARERLWNEEMPKIIANEAVKHFEQSFLDEGKTDKSLVKWADVKRRDPNSEWYGFKRENKKQFSPTRAVDKVLTDSGHLRESITYEIMSDRVRIKSDSPYAAVHQYGGQAKIFGKKAFTMTARPFIYRSDVLTKRIWDVFERMCKKEIDKIKNQ